MKYLAIVLLLLGSAIVHAQPSDRTCPPPGPDAHRPASVAAQRYAIGDFVGSAAKFLEAYELEGQPGYLFNIAQAYRHAGACAKAADYYGRYLAAVPRAVNAAKVREWRKSQLACAKLTPKNRRTP